MRLYGRGRKLVEDMRQTEYSYNALLKMTLVLGLLVRRISARGETVGILLPNLAATLCMVIGMTAFRRVPAMLNYTSGTDGIQSACVAARISTIVTSRKFLETARLQGQVDALRNVKIVYLEDLQPTVNLAVKLWALIHLAFPRLLGRGVDPESPAVVLFTSGSEGRPKGVVLSHRAILSNIAQIRAITDFSVEDRIFNALPVFHCFRTGRGRAAADSDRHQAVPVSLAAALSHHSGRSSTTVAAPSCSAPAPSWTTTPSSRIPTISTGCATWWPAPRSCRSRCARSGSRSSASASTKAMASRRLRRSSRSTPRWRPASAASGNCCPAWRPGLCRCPASSAAACCTCAAPTSCWATCITKIPACW